MTDIAPPKTRRSRKTIVIVFVVGALLGLLVCGGVIALCMQAISAAYRDAADRANRAWQISNAESIYLGLTRYAADHAGAYPPHVDRLVELGYLDDALVFDLPGPEPPAGDSPVTPPGSPHHTRGDFHFVYAARLAQTQPESMVMFGRNLDGHGRAVGFGDGRVAFMDEATFTAAVRDANARLAAQDRPAINPNALGDYSP